MEYKEEFDTRNDVFKYKVNDVSFYFVPNGNGKYEFCTKEETKGDFQVSLWMTRVKRKEVALDAVPFVIRDAIIKATHGEISKRSLIELRKDAKQFADNNGVDFKEKPISNEIRPPLCKDIKVLGLAVENYVESYHDSSMLYYNEEDGIIHLDSKKYHLIVQDVNNNNRYVIDLWTKHGMCSSGYTTASEGHINIRKMVKGMPFTHKPKGDLYIRGFSINPENFCWYQEYATREEEIGYWRTNEYNNVFSYEHIGDDPYYPSGRVNIKMDKFEKVERAMDKRPVWIIKGASGTGKSTLASHIEGLKVFETDSVDRLPPTIYEDVIVLGNRSKFSVEDVKSRLFGEHEAIVVSFEREGKVKERVNNINIDKNRDR